MSAATDASAAPRRRSFDVPVLLRAAARAAWLAAPASAFAYFAAVNWSGDRRGSAIAASVFAIALVQAVIAYRVAREQPRYPVLQGTGVALLAGAILSLADTLLFPRYFDVSVNAPFLTVAYDILMGAPLAVSAALVASTLAERARVVELSTRPREVPRRRLLDLLRAYQDVLDVAADLPLLVGTRSRLRLPRPTSFVRYFVLQHVSTSVTAINRGLQARKALNRAGDEDATERAAVEAFAASLPPPPRTRMRVLAILAVLFFAQVILQLVPVTTKATTSSTYAAIEEQKLLGQLTVPLLKLDVSGVGDTFGAIADARPVTILALALVLASSVYLALRGTTPSFRIKRVLFNTEATAAEALEATSLREDVDRARGVYELERRYFDVLELRRPSELPQDLAVSAIPAALLVLFGGFATYYAYKGYFTPEAIRVARFSGTLGQAFMGQTLIALGVWRLTWLSKTWIRRVSSNTLVFVGPRTSVSPVTQPADDSRPT